MKGYFLLSLDTVEELPINTGPSEETGTLYDHSTQLTELPFDLKYVWLSMKHIPGKSCCFKNSILIKLSYHCLYHALRKTKSKESGRWPLELVEPKEDFADQRHGSTEKRVGILPGEGAKGRCACEFWSVSYTTLKDMNWAKHPTDPQYLLRRNRCAISWAGGRVWLQPMTDKFTIWNFLHT